MPYLNAKRTYLLLILTIFISAAVIGMDAFRDDDFSRFDSPLYTDIAMNMLRTGNWLDIRDSHGTSYAGEHPPLTFWATAFVIKLFGESVFSAVLFSLLCAVGACAVVFLIGTMLKNDIVGFLSAMGLLLTRYVPRVARHNTIEIPLMFFVSLAVLFLILAHKKHRAFYLCFGLSVGLAALTKGIVGFSPLALAFLMIMVQRRFRDLISPFFISGLVLSLILPGGWFFLKGGATFNGAYAFLTGYINFVLHSFNKAVYLEADTRLRFITRLFEFCFLIMPGVFIGIYFVLRDAVKERKTELVIIPLWAILFITAFLISKWRIGFYLLPMYPAMAVLFGIGVNGIIPVNYKMYAVYLVIAFFCGNILAPFLFPHWEPKNIKEVIFANTHLPEARGALESLQLEAGPDTRFIVAPGEDESALSFFFGSKYKIEFCKDWESFKTFTNSQGPVIFFISKDNFSGLDKALHTKLKIVYSYGNGCLVTNRMDLPFHAEH